MKNRQKLTVSEKSLAKAKSDSEADGCLDIRVRRKISSNPLLQKNINFLQAYNNLFRKPSCNQIGDADSYFRQTLRSEPFDLIRDLNLSHLVRSARSFEGLNKRKPRSKRTLPSTKKTAVQPEDQSPFFDSYQHPEDKELHLKELFVPDIRDSDSENDDNDYFSPLNELEEVEEDPEEEISGLRGANDTEKVENSINEELREGKEAEEEQSYAIGERKKTDAKKMAEEETTFDEGDESAYEEFINDPDMEDDPDMGEDPVTITTDGEEEDEMREVEKMIERASKELQQVVEDNKELMQTLDEEEGMGEEEEGIGVVDTKKEPEAGAKKGGDQTGGGEGASVFKYDAAIDNAVLKELEDAEKQAKETAKIIGELKDRVTELSKKEQMTEEEAKELEQKNQQLKAQMMIFEEKTKRIQQLLGQTNLFEDMAMIKPALQKKHTEDILPKVIVCGLTEENIPKILICNDNKKCTPKKTVEKPAESPRTEFAKKLNECYCMQEKLAAENADLEGKRYKLQSDLVNKDQTVEYLQRQLGSLQTELRMVCKENCTLNEKLQNQSVSPCGHNKSRSSSPNQTKKMPCGKGKGICPADVEARLQEYSENTQNLEKQLGDMEAEVKGMHQELLAVQKEREHLEHHRKMLCQPPPCMMPPPCVPHPCVPHPCVPHPCLPQPCPPHPCMPAPCEPRPPCYDAQLRELREQYNRLQDDFKSKLTEVGGLRADNEKLKEKTKQAEEEKNAAEARLKELEKELKALRGQGKTGNSKEQMVELEQQLNVAKQRFREAQDELEELRSLVEDQQKQLDDYRNKYLEAQQQVEEQKRQIDLMEMENQRISEQVNLEIQRVKNQFQEKLQELMPLPDILKSTQMKLQETQQMHLLAERNNEAIARELKLYKDKIAAMTNQLDEVRSDQQLGADEKASLKQKLEKLEEDLKALQETNDALTEEQTTLNEKLEEANRTAEARLHEITQLQSQLETVREESARQVARTKDRCEIVRRSMQNQISDLERQLAQSRAMAKTAQKDRDDIRQKMQAQINNLNENFEDAQMRIRNLQGHVNFLKNSYGNVYPEKTDVPAKPLPDPCNCGDDY